MASYIFLQTYRENIYTHEAAAGADEDDGCSVFPSSAGLAVSASAAAPDFDSVRALRCRSEILGMRLLRRCRKDSRSDLRSDRRRGVAVSSVQLYNVFLFKHVFQLLFNADVFYIRWPGLGVGLVIKSRGFNSQSRYGCVMSLGKLFTPLCPSLNGTIWWWMMGGDALRLGRYRRSGTKLAIHYRLKWFIYLWSQGLGTGDEHPPVLLYVTFISTHKRLPVGRISKDLPFWISLGIQGFGNLETVKAKLFTVCTFLPMPSQSHQSINIS